MAEHSTNTPNALVPSPQVRRYVYAVALSLGPVVLFYGLATAQEVAMWAGVLGTVLGVPQGLALVNTPKPGPKP